MSLARDFILDYLEQRWRAFVYGEGNVPCGDCRGCCRAGYAIGLSHAEAAKLAELKPDDKVFTWIDGKHAVIMPLPNGRCPMLAEDDTCSVYDHRPMACRQYDCRDLALASVRIRSSPHDAAGVAEIGRAVERHHKSYGEKAVVPLAQQAEIFIKDAKLNAVAACQGAVGIGIVQMLSPEKAKAFKEAVLSQDERERGEAQAAFDVSIGVRPGGHDA
jgi:hypothetical protein